MTQTLGERLTTWAELAAKHGYDSWHGKPTSANRAFDAVEAIREALTISEDREALREALLPYLLSSPVR